VAGAVFYDENGNGVLDPAEGARVPDVVVEIGARNGRSSKVQGEFTVDGVPAGAQQVALRRGSLPPYYAAPPSIPVAVPQSQPLLVPLTLPIGRNRPNVYMGFGDSITIGQGSSDNNGYRSWLEERLRSHFGRGVVVDQGADATKSNRGAERIDDSLARARPAYTLILYGTNDWNVQECKLKPPCFTIDSLRDIVLSARGSQSLPVLSTIIPGDPTSFEQPARNEWVAAQNERIRAMAGQEGVPLADPYALFVKDPNFAHLYVDHVHPNDGGYQLIAQAFFTAIATPVETTGTSVAGGPALPALFVAPGSARVPRTSGAVAAPRASGDAGRVP